MLVLRENLVPFDFIRKLNFTAPVPSQSDIFRSASALLSWPIISRLAEDSYLNKLLKYWRLSISLLNR